MVSKTVVTFCLILQGKVKTIFDNMPKNNLEPTLKYDSHVFKNASKVTSLLSYRAFEHTQVSVSFIFSVFSFVLFVQIDNLLFPSVFYSSNTCMNLHLRS